jgi:iron complex outermembrane receptor protein
MKLKLKSMPLAISCVIASGALSVIAMPAIAQQADAQAVQRVVVTGSLISRTDKETPSPVQVITAEDIARSGKTSVAELLSELASNGQGALGTGFPGAFANGASGVSIHGLSVGLTLVLVDGHRVAAYPLSDDGQRSFVDVSSIPFDLIDRIEVQKDGASALYGSDAVAGVVNIILKKSFTGTRVNVEAGNSQHGGGKTYKASITTGIGNLQTDGYNAFIGAEYRQSNAIMLSQRDSYDWASGDWRNRGGNDLRRGVPTALNAFLTAPSSPFLYNPTGAGGVNNAANYQFLDPKCNFELYRAGQCYVRDVWSVLQPETDNINVLAGFTKKLGQDWQLGLKASMFQRHSYNNRGLPPAFSPTTYAGFTTLVDGKVTPNVGRIASTLIPANNALNKLGSPARLYGLVPQTDAGTGSDNTSKSTRFAADLTGIAFGWDIGAAMGITKVTTNIDYSGYLDRNALYTALFNGSFNPLGGNTPGMMQNVSPHFSNTLESTLNYIDVTAARQLMQLGAGPLSLAVGGHWHEREQNAPPSAPTLTGRVGNTSAFTIGSEKNTAVFAELAAFPVTGLELSTSARYDHYDTYGSSFTPSAKFKWAPIKQLAVRGTFSRGFRAPNPAEVGNAGSFFLFNAINDPILCADGNTKTKGNVPTACGINPTWVQVTSKDLKPEKSKSYTLGLVLEPVKDLSATLDYYKVDVTNQITSASTLPSFVPLFVRNPVVPTEISDGTGTTVLGTPPVGTINYAMSPYVNAGGVQTHGLELDMRYTLRLGEIGNLRASLNMNHMLGYELDPGYGDKVQLAGTHGPSSVGGNTGSPKNRANFKLDWDRGPLGVTASVNWVDSYSALDPSVGGNDCDHVDRDVGGRTFYQNSTVPAQYCRIASFTTTNLNVTYKVSPNVMLKASILNLFDRQPPLDVATYGSAGTNLSAYNSAMHQAGAVGRFFSVGANFTF